MSEAILNVRSRKRRVPFVVTNPPFEIYSEGRSARKGSRKRASESRLDKILNRGCVGTEPSRASNASEQRASTAEWKSIDSKQYRMFFETIFSDIRTRYALNETSDSEDIESRTPAERNLTRFFAEWVDTHADMSVVSFCDFSESVESTYSEIAADSTLPVERRSTALLDWLEVEQYDASQFLLSELEKTSDSDWQSWLVLLAEDTWFDEAEDRDKLVNKLLEIANARSSSRASADELVVRKAIRRAGMLLPADRLPELLMFTQLTAGVKAEVLGVFRTVLEIELPSTELESCIERIHELAMTYANPDVYSKGQIDSMLFDALVILSILGDTKISEVLARVEGLSRPFLLKQLFDNVSELADSSSFPGHGRQEINAALRQIKQLVKAGS